MIDKIEQVHAKAREMNKTAVVLNQYCKNFLYNEQIYNLSSITKMLEDLSDDIFHDLCKIIDNENTSLKTKYSLNIMPLCEFDGEIVD